MCRPANRVSRVVQRPAMFWVGVSSHSTSFMASATLCRPAGERGGEPLVGEHQPQGVADPVRGRLVPRDDVHHHVLEDLLEGELGRVAVAQHPGGDAGARCGAPGGQQGVHGRLHPVPAAQRVRPAVDERVDAGHQFGSGLVGEAEEPGEHQRGAVPWRTRRSGRPSRVRRCRRSAGRRTARRGCAVRTGRPRPVRHRPGPRGAGAVRRRCRGSTAVCRPSAAAASPGECSATGSTAPSRG